jgi:hypothetical protein
MHPETFEEMARRLVELERQLASTRTQLSESQRTSRRSRRIGVATHVVGLATIAIAIGIAGQERTHAQGQSVSAPFTVLDRGGKKMMEVREGNDPGTRLLILFNDQEQIATEMRTVVGGKGAVLVADPGSPVETGRVVLSVSPQGDGTFSMWDHQGNRMADIFRGKQGQGLGLYNPEGELAVEMASSRSFTRAPMTHTWCWALQKAKVRPRPFGSDTTRVLRGRTGKSEGCSSRTRRRKTLASCGRQRTAQGTFVSPVHVETKSRR